MPLPLPLLLLGDLDAELELLFPKGEKEEDFVEAFGEKGEEDLLGD